MSQLKTRQRVERWLLDHKAIINQTALEREIGVSKGVIQKFTKYQKKINNQDIKKLDKLIQKIFNDFK